MAFESRRKALLASTERRPSTSHVSLWRAEQSMKSPNVILVVNLCAWDRNGLHHSFTASIFRTELVARSELSFRILAPHSAPTTRAEHATCYSTHYASTSTRAADFHVHAGVVRQSRLRQLTYPCCKVETILDGELQPSCGS